MLCKDYRYAKRDVQSLRAEVNLLRESGHKGTLSGAVNAQTKNHEDELVELHEQWDVSLRPLWTGLAASLRPQMIACRQTIRVLVNLQNRTEMCAAYSSRESAHGDIVWIKKHFWSINYG